MANLIEQADLLKGLTNDRIALLMQNPAGDIPPFLVAAEAARRRAASEQATGDGNKESVVDTLTRQLSNVPQNIQAPMRTPPQMPPPMQPQMAGIGALPQGQQQMANGGPVRRFASEGFVSPSNPFDYVRENYPISSLPNTIANVGSVIGEAWNSPTAKQATDRLLMETGRAADFITLNPYTSQVLGIDPKSVRERREQSEIEDIGPTEGILDIEYPDAKIVPGRNPLPDKPAPETAPAPKEPPGTGDTSRENKYKAMEADMRKRLEGLYGDEEASGWENAQKWFAASQQIMNPDATLMQSLVNAGSAYADASGDQAAEQRQAARAREEALLNWDMQIMQGDRAAEAAAAAKAQERAYKLEDRASINADSMLKYYGDQYGAALKLANEEMDPVKKEELLKKAESFRILAADLIGGGDGSGVVTRDQIKKSQ